MTEHCLSTEKGWAEVYCCKIIKHVFLQYLKTFVNVSDTYKTIPTSSLIETKQTKVNNTHSNKLTRVVSNLVVSSSSCKALQIPPETSPTPKIYLAQGQSMARGVPGSSVVKDPPANAGEAGNMGSIPRLGRSPGGGNGNPSQCLGNPTERGACRTTLHGVTKSCT